MKHFYSHIIDLNDLVVLLDPLELQPEEKEELLIIAHATVHHVIVDTVLIYLPEEEHTRFLDNLGRDAPTKTWRHLKEHVEGLDEKVKSAYNEARDLLLGDLG